MELIARIGGAYLAMAALMTVLWALQKRNGRAGIVDVAWALGTGILGVLFAATADGDGARRVLVGALAGVWGARLAAHLWARLRREGEDGRYAMLRRQWGERTQRNLAIFFQIQAAWAVLFALPMLVAAANPAPGLRWLDALGALLFLVSLGGEIWADRELAAFRRDTGGEGVCRRGPWRYTRHPNYFFEWIHWWAYVPIAAGGPWWGLTLLFPALMYLFLTRITGIPPTEARAVERRGDAYRRYQENTNAFFPGPPRGEGAQ